MLTLASCPAGGILSWHIVLHLLLVTDLILFGLLLPFLHLSWGELLVLSRQLARLCEKKSL